MGAVKRLANETSKDAKAHGVHAMGLGTFFDDPSFRRLLS